MRKDTTEEKIKRKAEAKELFSSVLLMQNLQVKIKNKPDLFAAIKDTKMGVELLLSIKKGSNGKGKHLIFSDNGTTLKTLGEPITKIAISLMKPGKPDEKDLMGYLIRAIIDPGIIITKDGALTIIVPSTPDHILSCCFILFGTIRDLLTVGEDLNS